MKQSPFAPLTSTPMAIRYNGGVDGVSTPTSGVTYVIQSQGKPQGILRPVSIAQQHQVNGSAPVVFRRFPNNNVVQVRRLMPQEQAPQKQQPQSGGGGTGTSPLMKIATVKNNEVTLDNNHEAANGDKEQMSTSEADSEGSQEVWRVGQQKDNVKLGKLNEQGPKNDACNEQLNVKKRKRMLEEVENIDLLIDQDLEDQEGDVIDEEEDCEQHCGDDKTAFELNGAELDDGFLRHVIETQILNRHKTRIKDWDGTKGQMCQSCHETFLTEAGLETHRNRKIHHIFFYCSLCKRDLSFFNKCRLIKHLRNHRVTPTVSDLQNCVMIRLLPETEYLNFKYEDCTSSSEDDDPDSHFNNGGFSSSSNGGSIQSKRLKPKPSKFRRIARGNNSVGRDSDHSPPPPPLPNICRQIVQPPQLSSPQSVIAENATTTIVSTLNNASTNSGSAEVCSKLTGATISSNQEGNRVLVEEEGIRSKMSHGPAIKNVESTTSVIIPPSAATDSNTVDAFNKDSSPQIRIRNLSQITSSVNDDDDAENSNERNEMRVTSDISANSNNINKYCCYKCDRYFRSAADFFKHLQEAEQDGLSSRSLHRCPTDDIPSWSHCGYVFHTKVFHEKSAPFLCLGCGNECSNYKALLEHVTNDCFYLSQRVRYMCAAATVTKCSFFDRKSVKTEPEVLNHLKKEHSRFVYQCLHCTQGFATDNWLLKHLTEAHGIQLDESKGSGEREALIARTTRPLTQCLICNILFPNGPTYLQHVYLNFHVHIHHAKMLECQNCFCVFETHEKLLSHRQSNESCRKLDPSSMKISEVDAENGSCSTDLANVKPEIVSPTSSFKIRNTPPAAIVSPQSTVHPSPTVTSSVTALSEGTSNSSSNEVVSSSLLSQVPLPRSQNNSSDPSASHILSSCTTAHPEMSKLLPHPVSSKSPTKTAFDDLLSCQFCERLVIYGSLRKHEDQCCGLSFVDEGFCLTCKGYFGTRSALASHGLMHLSEGVPICPFCNNRHIRPTHPKSTTPNAHENLFALKKHLYSNHTSKIVRFPWNCSICSARLSDKRAAEFHIKDHLQLQQFGKKLDVRASLPQPVAISQEDLQNMIMIRRKGVDPKRKILQKTIEVYYCPVCKNREFAMEAGLTRHLKLVHQTNPKNLNMTLLKKPSTARRFVVKVSDQLNYSSNSLKLIDKQNSLSNKPLLRSVSTCAVPRSTSKVSSAVSQTGCSTSGGPQVTVSSASSTTSFTSRFSSNIVLRKRLAPPPHVNTPCKTLPNLKQGTSLISKPSNKTSSSRPIPNFLQTRSSSKTCRQKNGTIICFRCPNSIYKTENEYCEHVKWKHVWTKSEIEKLKFGNRIDEPTEYWCPECDTTFVAKSTLVRHLKFAHDYIRSAEEYMQKIGYEGKKPVQPNQCEVCYYQCQGDRELQQHIRTHGMAFLRLRQQRQTNTKGNT